MDLYSFCQRMIVTLALIETLVLIVPDSSAAATKRNKKPSKRICGFHKEKGKPYVYICARRIDKLQQCSCPKGRRGQKGARGRQGPSGLTGPPGVAGNDGRDGRIGLRGLPGMPGLMGKPGLKGTMGPVGPQGPAGLPGRDGTPGPPGPPGIQGACSKSSGKPTTNIIRSSCLPGAPGPRGEPGMAGQTGPTGPRGPSGNQGQHGDPGTKGSRGDRGPSGPPGRIASLRCVVEYTPWFTESKWKSLTPEIGCNGSAFLQKFALQRTSPNMRYKYTCCTFQ